MPSSPDRPHADLLLRLDQLPLPAHERELAKARARFAFGIVDALFDAVNDARAGFAALRRGASRPQRAH